jgi:hypothetical protein
MVLARKPKDKTMSKKKPAKAKTPKTVRTKTVTNVVDIDLANRDNVAASVRQNCELSEQDSMIVASVLIEAKQLLVKNWRTLRQIQADHFDGKLKFNMPVVLDCTDKPAVVKVKLAIPRPAHKDAAETSTDDPAQLKLNTVDGTIPVRTGGGAVALTVVTGETAIDRAPESAGAHP